MVTARMILLSEQCYLYFIVRTSISPRFRLPALCEHLRERITRVARHCGASGARALRRLSRWPLACLLSPVASLSATRGVASVTVHNHVWVYS
eukprot:4552682-Prymnesium_polylepis.1